MHLGLASVKNANNGTDGIAIGFGSDKMQAQGTVCGADIVAKEKSRAVVGGEQQIDVTIAIEIGKGEAASDAWNREITAIRSGDILKFSIAEIQKKLWRLRVADIAANVSNRVVDVAIGDDEIKATVEIEIGKAAAKAKSIF